jgi:DNA adenine methylase
LDVRFNREKLVKRLNALYALREEVDAVECVDWRLFTSRYRSSRSAYVYLDPPYYHRAEQLYGHLFNHRAHTVMRDYLLNLSTPWMLSYDDAPEVRSLYGGLVGIDGRVLDQTYSAHPVGGASFVGRELFFSNRPLPSKLGKHRSNQHIGLSLVGCLKSVAASFEGPIRVAFEREQAIAA